LAGAIDPPVETFKFPWEQMPMGGGCPRPAPGAPIELKLH
jgi:hypothetical protein